MIFNPDNSISFVVLTCSGVTQHHLITESSGFLNESVPLFLKIFFKQLKVSRKHSSGRMCENQNYVFDPNRVNNKLKLSQVQPCVVETSWNLELVDAIKKIWSDTTLGYIVLVQTSELEKGESPWSGLRSSSASHGGLSNGVWSNHWHPGDGMPCSVLNAFCFSVQAFFPLSLV